MESTFHRAARVRGALSPFKDTFQKLHTKKFTNNACCRGCIEKEHSYTVGERVKLYQHHGEQYGGS